MSEWMENHTSAQGGIWARCSPPHSTSPTSNLGKPTLTTGKTSSNAVMGFWRGRSPPSKGEALEKQGCWGQGCGREVQGEALGKQGCQGQGRGSGVQVGWTQLGLALLELQLQELFVQVNAMPTKPLQVQGKAENLQKRCLGRTWLQGANTET